MFITFWAGTVRPREKNNHFNILWQPIRLQPKRRGCRGGTSGVRPGQAIAAVAACHGASVPARDRNPAKIAKLAGSSARDPRRVNPHSAPAPYRLKWFDGGPALSAFRLEKRLALLRERAAWVSGLAAGWVYLALLDGERRPPRGSACKRSSARRSSPPVGRPRCS